MKKDFKVRVEMPPSVTVSQMSDFIRECVSNPVNPSIRMDWDKVTVRPIGEMFIVGRVECRANRTLDGTCINDDGSIEGHDADL